MKGFKDFLMRGNLVELAVAFVMAAAFGKVVEAFVTVIMDIIGKIGNTPSFSNYQPAGVHVGLLITVLISFVILAAVVYFFVVKPYEVARARFFTEPEVSLTELDVLTEIRDALQMRR